MKQFKLAPIRRRDPRAQAVKLAKLEIRVIRESSTPRRPTQEDQGDLRSEDKLWTVIKDELKATGASARLAAAHQDRRDGEETASTPMRSSSTRSPHV